MAGEESRTFCKPVSNWCKKPGCKCSKSGSCIYHGQEDHFVSSELSW